MSAIPRNYPHTACLSAHRLSSEKQDHWLFENITFSIEPGQLLHLAGRNGSGKTTLLRILCGLTTADEGKVNWNNKNIDSQRDEYHSQLTYVGHTDGIKDNLTVEENLRISAVLARAKSQKHLPIDTQQALTDVDLKRKKYTLVHNLSAGQRRRLALARCLLNDTSIWILDEPLTALDSKGVIMVESMVNAHLQRKGIVIMTSHQNLNVDERRYQKLTLT